MDATTNRLPTLRGAADALADHLSESGRDRTDIYLSLIDFAEAIRDAVRTEAHDG